MNLFRVLSKVVKRAGAMKKRNFGFLLNKKPKCLFLCLCWPLILLLFSNGVASAACLANKARLAEVKEWVSVDKIIDGDTVHLNDGRKIRFIGINTLEIGRRGEASEPYAQQAFEALKKLLSGQKNIGLSYDQEKKDRYKRTLAYITLKDGRSVEQALLEQGMAFSIAVPPNIKRLECFRVIEEKAREKHKGVWRLPEMQLIRSSNLSGKARGYRFILGRVSEYSENKKNIFLKLNSKLSVRIARKDIKYFDSQPLKSLVGKNVVVRGWLSQYKGRQYIHVRTSNNIQLHE